MAKIHVLLAFLAISICCPGIQAQRTSNYFMAGLGLGVTNYKGDLDDNFALKFTKPGLSFIGMYKFANHLKARFTLSQGWIGASDEKAGDADFARLRRNLSFTSSLTEASMQLVFDVLSNKRKFKFRPKFSPFFFAGVAVFHFNPRAELNGVTYNLQPLGTEGQFLPGCTDCPDPYSRVQVALPFGTGLRFTLMDRIDLAVELGVRKTFTDYLDDVSGNYPDMAAMQAWNPIAYQLSDRIDKNQYPLGGAYVNGIRGNNERNDWYVMTMVSAVYVFKWTGSPKFR